MRLAVVAALLFAGFLCLGLAVLLWLGAPVQQPTRIIEVSVRCARCNGVTPPEKALYYLPLCWTCERAVEEQLTKGRFLG